jgi:hypothetical protein
LPDGESDLFFAGGLDRPTHVGIVWEIAVLAHGRAVRFQCLMVRSAQRVVAALWRKRTGIVEGPG